VRPNCDVRKIEAVEMLESYIMGLAVGFGLFIAGLIVAAAVQG
jgi:hypothetical protein